MSGKQPVFLRLGSTLKVSQTHTKRGIFVGEVSVQGKVGDAGIVLERRALYLPSKSDTPT